MRPEAPLLRFWPLPVDSTLPAESATVTWFGSSPTTLAATRCTTDCTWSELSVRPSAVVTSTEAVGFWLSVANTSFCGIARCTVAPWTPSIDLIVLPSSPSSARW